MKSCFRKSTKSVLPNALEKRLDDFSRKKMTTLLKLRSFTDDKDAKVHFIPAEIQCDGPASVSKYFESTVRQGKDESEMTASLRGRPLHGNKFQVPSGYTGLILNEARKPCTEDEDRELTPAQTFKSFNYWNLDRQPSDGDKLHQALLWIDIAKALHAPVDSTPADSQGSLKSEVSI